MPSPSRGTAVRPKVDRSTSPLSRKPAGTVNPVQELKALFAEPTTRTSNGEKESDFRFEAIQCLRSTIVKKPDDLPERGSWSTKVRIISI